MCKIDDEFETKLKDPKLQEAFSKIRTSDYRKYFPDHNFEPTEQLNYIKTRVEEFRREEDDENNEIESIQRDKEKYKNNDEETYLLEAVENEYGFIYMRHDALRANMQIALLAPAIEGVYKKSLRVLIEEKLGIEELEKCFNGHMNFRGGVVKGIMQALNKLEIESNFHPNIGEYLSALFDYRNALFHNGLEWHEEDCKNLIENHKESWFTWHASSCSLYFILPTKEFIDELIEFFAGSIDGFAKSKQEVDGNTQ